MRISTFLISLLVTLPASAETIFISGATIIDGTGANAQDPLDITVTDGKIERIGTGIRPRGATVIDARGKIVLPGLIDAHVHLPSVTGANARNDTPEQAQELRHFEYKALIAAGVTTVLDAAAPASLLKSPPSPAPRIVGLAPFLTPVGGYFSDSQARGFLLADLWAPVATPEDVHARITEAAPLKPLGVKVTIETGFGPFPSWPTFDEGMRKSIKDEAAKAGLPVFVHSMSKAEHRLALSMNPYTLVHAGFYDEEPDDEILSEIKTSGAYVISTLAAWRLAHLMWERDLLEDPWVARLVPKRMLETALDEKIREQILKDVVVQSRPGWLPAWAARLFAPLFFSEKIVRSSLEHGKAAIAKMNQAGIPLVMGSDSGNWAVWATYFHGVGSILEMEMLVESGLTPMEAIQAGTARAAKMLKIDSETGTVAVGKRADLLILDADPLTDPKAFRKVAYVVKDGVLKTPADWLK